VAARTIGGTRLRNGEYSRLLVIGAPLDDFVMHNLDG
jgi:hypothetical protein